MSGKLSNPAARPTLLALLLLPMLVGFPALLEADVIAFDMVASASQNLVSYTDDPAIPFTSPGDGFNKFQRGVSLSIPFAVVDDSAGSFPPDTLGIIKTGNTDEFFGIVDTNNDDTGGRDVVATWVFDISGATDLGLSIDMGAMGDFEAAGDFFNWSYSIDGGPAMTAFQSSVDEAGSYTYTMESGTLVTLNDPMLVNGVLLTNDLAPFFTTLSGSGSQLTLILTANTNGGSEAIAFQNLIISGTAAPAAIAFDMVASASQNLVSYTDDPAIPFTSPGDGFNKFQRGVSLSIPFAVVDDSAGSFPPDTLGIIKTGNTDEFFGIVDTNNDDTGGRDVVATWVFDISGATDLGLSIDMGAMGDFEAAGDFFNWSYSIDGGPAMTAFQSSVDEAGSYTYTMESGTLVTLNDPMLVNGVLLTNDLAPFFTTLSGSGSQLTLILTANTNGGSEAIAFQNLIISAGNPPPPPPPLREIYEIQGDGLSSPYEGELVTTEDNVVTALGVDGFFMQTPAARTDGNVDTSDGIFVFTGARPTVAAGDQVDLEGRVQEFFGMTEITDVAMLEVDGVGLIPDPVSFNATVPSPDPMAPSCLIEFECYEGMYIEILDGAVTGPNQRFSTDEIAEVHITAAPARTFREPGILFPGIGGLPVWDGNPEVFELDPNKLGLPNEIIPAGSSFSARGALGFEFGGYELWPSELAYVPAEIPRAVRDRVAGEFTVGSLNMFRFFDDVDDPPSENALGEERDDTVVTTAEYLRRTAKFVDHVLNVLDAPDVLAVQEVEKIGVLEDLAVAIALEDPTVVYTPVLEEGNDIGTIDIGFMVRDAVTIDGFQQLGYSETYFNPVDMTLDILHDRPPLLLEGRFELEFGSFPIAVMTVHNRSLGGIDDPVDGERVRQKRYEQAVSIAEKVQALQEADPEIHFVVIGDFNAFEFTDGYVDAVGQIKGDFVPDDNLICDPDTGNACDDLVDPDLTNQTLDLPPEERYSFIFRGNAQALDHALTAEGLGSFLAGLELGRGNADAAFDLINDDSTPLRSSDHDGLVLFVAGDADNDGVPDDVDVCPATVIPESVPTEQLGVNRYALVDGDRLFDTSARGQGGNRSFTLGDTVGCSCEQIIVAQGLGEGHEKFGCSLGEMREWVQLVNP